MTETQSSPIAPARPLWLRVLSAPFLGLLVLILFLEEWAWEPLQALAARIGRLPILRSLERWIASLPPKGALAVFVLPSLVLLPFKVLALAAFARGLFLMGLGIAVSAKIIGTALVARIFTLTKPALLTLPWFARAHAWLGDLKARAIQKIRASWVWQLAHRIRVAFAARARQLIAAFLPSNGKP